MTRLEEIKADPTAGDYKTTDLMGKGIKGGGRPLDYKTEFMGLPISIENQRGSIRRWTNRATGEEGERRFSCPYGYIRLTESPFDGDHLDCFLGPEKTATHAYVIKQMKWPDFTDLDEEKVMLGFPDQNSAVAAYKAHYTDPRFFGGCRAVCMGEFVHQVAQQRGRPLLLKSRLRVLHATKADGLQSIAWLDRVLEQPAFAKGAGQELMTNAKLHHARHIAECDVETSEIQAEMHLRHPQILFIKSQSDQPTALESTFTPASVDEEVFPASIVNKLQALIRQNPSLADIARARIEEIQRTLAFHHHVAQLTQDEREQHADQRAEFNHLVELYAELNRIKHALMGPTAAEDEPLTPKEDRPMQTATAKTKLDEEFAEMIDTLQRFADASKSKGTDVSPKELVAKAMSAHQTGRLTLDQVGKVCAVAHDQELVVYLKAIPGRVKAGMIGLSELNHVRVMLENGTPHLIQV